MLSSAELNRYNRHIILPEIGMAGQEKLKQARVLVIGAGGLGCPVLQYLVAAGVGTIGIADFDVVSESNLHRQILFSAADVGKPKAEVAAQKLAAQNPFVQFRLHTDGITAQNAIELVQDYDIVVDGSDNFPTRYLVNDACAIEQKPLVFGAIFKFEGQASVFHYKNGPSYRCLFPEPPSRNEVPNCSEVGVMGVLPGLIGTIQATEVIKIICEAGEVLSGKLLLLNSLNMETSSIKFKRTAKAEVTALQPDYEAFCAPASVADDEINEISADELKDLLDEEADFQLLDVREPYEYEQYNMEGTLLPLSTLEQQLDKVEPSKTVVVHCKTGSRSRQAIQLLQQHFPETTFYNLTGGIDQYPY